LFVTVLQQKKKGFAMQRLLTDEQWGEFHVMGYLKLGKLMDDAHLAALQQRIDDIMLGKADIPYDRVMMQLDSSTGEYDDIGEQTKGHKGATLNYRKIEQLELDPLFLEYIQMPLFKEMCDRMYGQHVPVAVFRSMFMNKPAGLGTKLPWHQDRWTRFDRDPLLTVWTALDPATKENGCVQVIPRSHQFGIINREHNCGFLTEQQAREHCPDSEAIDVILEPGECMLLHNWLLHSSDKNHSDQSRRAFSVCYMDARTQSNLADDLPVVFGEGAMSCEQLESARQTA